MRSGRGKLGARDDLQHSGVRLTVPVRGLVFVVPKCAVMMVVPELDGRFVGDGLL
jgi:hypothetical protein